MHVLCLHCGAQIKATSVQKWPPSEVSQAYELWSHMSSLRALLTSVKVSPVNAHSKGSALLNLSQCSQYNTYFAFPTSVLCEYIYQIILLFCLLICCSKISWTMHIVFYFHFSTNCFKLPGIFITQRWNAGNFGKRWEYNDIWARFLTPEKAITLLPYPLSK